MTDPLEVASDTARVCAAAGVDASKLVELVASARFRRIELAAARREVPAAEDALRRAKAAWGDDQTDARWQTIEAAETALARLQLRVESIEAAAERAESALPHAHNTALAAERACIEAEYQAAAVPLLVEFLRRAAALEEVAVQLGAVASRAWSRMHASIGRAHVAGFRALAAELPVKLHTRSTSWALAGGAITKAFAPARASQPVGAIDRLAGDPCGSALELRAVARAVEIFTAERDDASKSEAA